MTVEQIIAEKLKRLDSVPAEFNDNVQKFEKVVLNEILRLFDELEIVGGKVAVTEYNLLISSKISEQLRKVFVGKDYVNILSEYVKQFDKQAEINDAYFAKEFGEVTDKTILNVILKKNKQDAINLLSGGSIDANFINPVRTFIDNSIVSNSNLSDVIKGINQIAVTNDKTNSKLLQYSKQIASDAFSFADRGYTKVASEALQIVWYKYQGGEVEDSRCFCVERHGNYYHQKEIEAWGDGKQLGSCRVGTHWAGAYKNTNRSNIFTVAGGYNCMHSILPTSITVVNRRERSAILRNIENGNFKPNEKEKQILNLK